MTDVVVLSAARSPIGAFLGAFREVPAPDIAAQVLNAAVAKAGLEPSDVQQLNLGCVLPAGIGQAPARQAALGAGCPPGTGAVTLNKVCGSGMRAVMMAANDLRCGDYSVVAAGGMENMSRSPFLLPQARRGLRLGAAELVDSVVHDGLWDPYNDVHMGNCAEICADHYAFDRAAQDDFALESYRRARRATEDGTFAREIVAISTPSGEVSRDEEPFRVDLDRIRSLRPAFQGDGSVTAGNASSLDDGAAVLVLTTAERGLALGLQPVARIVAQASVAQEPEWFTTAPVAAIRAVLARGELEVGDIDLFEINEAFAVVAMACTKELELDPERVNVHGGAVALGHPIGA
ncbi:MAG: thiolase family protein, partial [Thermoanaerobaculia bacterium]|nr:thiolase family protein [Thermoanaerobaculia bacterium]